MEHRPTQIIRHLCNASAPPRTSHKPSEAPAKGIHIPLAKAVEAEHYLQLLGGLCQSIVELLLCGLRNGSTAAMRLHGILVAGCAIRQCLGDYMGAFRLSFCQMVKVPFSCMEGMCTYFFTGNCSSALNRALALSGRRAVRMHWQG